MTSKNSTNNPIIKSQATIVVDDSNVVVASAASDGSVAISAPARRPARPNLRRQIADRSATSADSGGIAMQAPPAPPPPLSAATHLAGMDHLIIRSNMVPPQRPTYLPARYGERPVVGGAGGIDSKPNRYSSWVAHMPAVAAGAAAGPWQSPQGVADAAHRLAAGSGHRAPHHFTSPFSSAASRVLVVNPMQIVNLSEHTKSRLVKFIEAIKKFSEKWFSHVLLLLFLAVYACFGAYIFISFEAPTEQTEKQAIYETRTRIVDEMWQLVSHPNHTATTTKSPAVDIVAPETTTTTATATSSPNDIQATSPPTTLSALAEATATTLPTTTTTEATTTTIATTTDSAIDIAVVVARLAQPETNSLLTRDMFVNELLSKIEDYERMLNRYCQFDLTNSNHTLENQWNFWGALFYSMTVFTTIGYGHLTPITFAGRVATMVYAIFGIPILLMVLADLGKLLTRIIKYTFKQFRYIYNKLMHRKESLRTRKLISDNTNQYIGVARDALERGVAYIHPHNRFPYVFDRVNHSMRLTRRHNRHTNGLDPSQSFIHNFGHPMGIRAQPSAATAAAMAQMHKSNTASEQIQQVNDGDGGSNCGTVTTDVIVTPGKQTKPVSPPVQESRDSKRLLPNPSDHSTLSALGKHQSSPLPKSASHRSHSPNMSRHKWSSSRRSQRRSSVSRSSSNSNLGSKSKGSKSASSSALKDTCVAETTHDTSKVSARTNDNDSKAKKCKILASRSTDATGGHEPEVATKGDADGVRRTSEPAKLSDYDAGSQGQHQQLDESGQVHDNIEHEHEHEDEEEDEPEEEEEEDDFDIPVSFALFLLVSYMMCGAVVFSIWEGWSFFEALYFVFISMSTIGFGDLVPQHPKRMIGTFAYLLFGLALTSMCINVVQEKIHATFLRAKMQIGEKMGFDLDQIMADDFYGPDSSFMPMDSDNEDAGDGSNSMAVSQTNDGCSEADQDTNLTGLSTKGMRSPLINSVSTSEQQPSKDRLSSKESIRLKKRNSGGSDHGSSFRRKLSKKHGATGGSSSSYQQHNQQQQSNQQQHHHHSNLDRLVSHPMAAAAAHFGRSSAMTPLRPAIELVRRPEQLSTATVQAATAHLSTPIARGEAQILTKKQRPQQVTTSGSSVQPMQRPQPIGPVRGFCEPLSRPKLVATRSQPTTTLSTNLIPATPTSNENNLNARAFGVSHVRSFSSKTSPTRQQYRRLPTSASGGFTNSNSSSKSAGDNKQHSSLSLRKNANRSLDVSRRSSVSFELNQLDDLIVALNSSGQSAPAERFGPLLGIPSSSARSSRSNSPAASTTSSANTLTRRRGTSMTSRPSSSLSATAAMITPQKKRSFAGLTTTTNAANTYLTPSASSTDVPNPLIGMHNPVNSGNLRKNNAHTTSTLLVNSRKPLSRSRAALEDLDTVKYSAV